LEIFLKSFAGITLIAALVGPAAARGRGVGAVEKVSVASETPFQIQIATNFQASPQVQLVPGPDRLIVDIPNSAPGASLRGLSINRAGVRGVRVSQYSAKPPVTRVVVDLSGPEWYRVAPDASGLIVSLGTSAESAQNFGPAIGWVSARVKSTRSAPVVLRRTTATQFQRVNGVIIRYDSGRLSIHAENATLSEVLFQIQKQTGAQIAIPAGTEQERVSSDFGPGTPSEVLGQLLNGSGLNFVVVGSDSDPNQLRNVILSRKTGEADPPSAFATPELATPPATPVIDAKSPEFAMPPADNASPQEMPGGPPPATVPSDPAPQ
jgi:AMIN domain